MSLTTSATNVTTAAAGLGASAKNASALNSVNFDTFLKLLVAQLENQDPLNPMEGTEFTSQIAQFSSLEQQINGNNLLERLVSERDFGQQTLANSYLGRSVLGPGNLLKRDGTATTIGYEAGEGATRVSLEILNNTNGQVVRTLNGDPSKGVKTMVWDGKDSNGQLVSGETFTLRVRATDSDNKVRPSTGYVFGTVSSILNDANKVSLQMADGRSIDATSVIGVRQ